MINDDDDCFHGDCEEVAAVAAYSVLFTRLEFWQRICGVSRNLDIWQSANISLFIRACRLQIVCCIGWLTSGPTS